MAEFFLFCNLCPTCQNMTKLSASSKKLLLILVRRENHHEHLASANHALLLIQIFLNTEWVYKKVLKSWLNLLEGMTDFFTILILQILNAKWLSSFLIYTLNFTSWIKSKFNQTWGLLKYIVRYLYKLLSVIRYEIYEVSYKSSKKTYHINRQSFYN